MALGSGGQRPLTLPTPSWVAGIAGEDQAGALVVGTCEKATQRKF